MTEGISFDSVGEYNQLDAQTKLKVDEVYKNYISSEQYKADLAKGYKEFTQDRINVSSSLDKLDTTIQDDLIKVGELIGIDNPESLMEDISTNAANSDLHKTIEQIIDNSPEKVVDLVNSLNNSEVFLPSTLKDLVKSELE